MITKRENAKKRQFKGVSFDVLAVGQKSMVTKMNYMKNLFFLFMLFYSFSVKAQDISFIEDTTNGNGSYTSLKAALKNPDDVINLELDEEDIADFLYQTEKFHKIERLILFGSKNIDDSVYLNISKLKTLKNLCIEYSYLKSFPEEIVSLLHLTNLTINTCNIYTIDYRLFRNTNIEQADLTANFLQWLPNYFSDTCKLKVLSLRDNELHDLPKSFTNLGKLEFLNLSHNHFNQFPVEILPLKNLKVLNIGFNPLDSIPKGIVQLENLEVLYLIKTGVRSLPASFKFMKSLKHIYISSGTLSEGMKNQIEKALPKQCTIEWTDEDYFHSCEFEIRNPN